MYKVAFLLISIIFIEVLKGDLFCSRIDGDFIIQNSLIILDIHEIASDTECAFLCIRNKLCLSFGFHSDCSTCRLLPLPLNNTMMQRTDGGWMYFNTDRCGPEWTKFEQSCYKTELDHLSFSDAQNHCMSVKGHLIYINTPAENLFAQNIVQSVGDGHFWIGLSREANGWRWSPKQEVTTMVDWDTIEPSDYENEDCALIHKSTLKWHDYNCIGPLSFICEKEIL